MTRALFIAAARLEISYGSPTKNLKYSLHSTLIGVFQKVAEDMMECRSAGVIFFLLLFPLLFWGMKILLSHHLATLLKKLPSGPGVYQFFDAAGEILYIGKAKNLKNRVRSYFQEGPDHSPKTQRLREKIADLQWIEAHSETEALILESHLVREHLPRFNVLLRDDKHFLYVKITREPFPNVEFTRHFQKDTGVFFGPFTSSQKIRDLVDAARELLRFRMCRVSISAEGQVIKNPEKRKIPCLDYQIGRCSAPCDATLSLEKYAEDIAVLRDILRGKTRAFSVLVREKMTQAATEKKFETAARMRDILLLLEHFGQKQIADMAMDFSADAIGFFFGTQKSFFSVFVVREGKILRVESLSIPSAETAEATIMAFFRDFPAVFPDIPSLFLAEEFSERLLFSQFFSEVSGRSVEIRVPERGSGRALLDLAQKNAALLAANARSSFETVDPLIDLQEALSLPHRPEHIECYDISHLGGTHTVGSRVVFRDGEAYPAEYRQYKIRDLAFGEINDFAAIAEVLGRRLRRLSAEQTSSLQMVLQTGDALAEAKKYCSLPAAAALFAFFDQKLGEQIGFLVLGRTGKTEEILDILVFEKFRGRGLGTEMIRLFLQQSAALVVRLVLNKKTHFRFFLALQEFGFILEKKPPRFFQKKREEADQQDAGERVCLKISPGVFQKSTKKFPDLLVIDGGKGQLSAVVEVMKREGFFEKIPVCSLAKREEEVFLPGRSAAIFFPKKSPGNELLQRIRDEAHRFAISCSRKWRQKTALSSAGKTSKLKKKKAL